MKLIMRNTFTYVEFGEGDNYLRDVFLKRMHKTLGVRQEGFQFSPAYKNGHWDGYVDFYDFENNRFPTGLITKVTDLLGELQGSLSFQYEIVDDRSESFLAPEDIDEEIDLFDNNVGKITLREYQYEAVYNALTNFNGILHLATNGGKCITEDSYLLTPNGYKTLRDIFNSNDVICNSDEEVLNIKYPLINRYGEIEYTSHFTKNGIKPTLNIVTDRGVKLQSTYNHPLLVLKDNKFVWKKSEDLSVGDVLISRKGDSQFGNDETVASKEEAYVLGCMTADSYMGISTRLSFSNDKPELLNAVSKYWSSISDRDVYYDVHKKSKGVTIHLHHAEKAREFYTKFGLHNGVAKDKEIPKCIIQAPKEIQIAFISGFLECESSIDQSGRRMEVSSASQKLLTQLQMMLFNLGVDNTLKQKVVKGYEDNYYGRLTINTNNLHILLNLIEFKTPQRLEQKENSLQLVFKSQYGNKFYGLREMIKEYRATISTPSVSFKKYTSRDEISVQKLREMITTYPDGDSAILKYFSELTDDNIFYQKIESITDGGMMATFDVCMPNTHSFIANSIVNHNTECASGIINQLLPQLQTGERIAFFTGSTEIFNQSAERLQERLNIKVGKVGSGKFDIQQVTVVMIPTLNAGLKDPTQGVKLTPKQNIYKKIATEILPKLEDGTNQRKMLGMLAHNYPQKTKVDEKVKVELIHIYDTCGTDNKVLLKLKSYNVKYQEAVRGKNTKKYDKFLELREFLDSIAVMIVDEAHHSKSDTWYNNLMSCENALYRIALTGSIDTKNSLLWMRMQALFGDIVARTSNNYLIENGHSARPTINIIPIANPNNIDKINDYRQAYDLGITNNEFRNKLVARLTEKWYNQGKGILIIVNFVTHGENIAKMLDEAGVDHYFLHGEIEPEIRKKKLDDMRSGKLKVMISTSLIDEGVDISGINALVLCAGGKSLRQTLQRVGRALRKKKDDNTCQIYDFNDMTNKFLYTHSQQRIAIYEDEEFEIKHLGNKK